MTSPEPIRRLSLVQAGLNAKEAMAQADEHASELFKEDYFTMLGHVAKRRPKFWSDHTWDAMETLCPDTFTHENRATGPLWKKAVSSGLIIPSSCDYCGTEAVMRYGRRNKANKTLVPEYTSLIYRGY